MANKFNGFTQEEIKKISGGVGVGSTKTSAKSAANKPEIFKEAFRGKHVGIRRMPENARKQTQHVSKNHVAASSIAKIATLDENTTKKLNNNQNKNDNNEMLTKSPDTTTIENPLDTNNRSMSHSIEEALFFQPLKKTLNGGGQQQQKFSEKTVQISESHNDTTNCSSILDMPTTTHTNEHNVTTRTENVDDDVDDDDKLNDSSILQHVKNFKLEIPAAAATGIGIGVNADAGTGVGTPTFQNVLKTDSPYKGISLKDFETHRRMIQEQNKQKKEMLYKAIEHHSQKTAAETKKIEEIKSELAKLDNDLAVDVAILRKQIDNACIQFSTIEKQYIKIESQFLKAKMDLHNAAEKKELLTEHLCTVIAHNEDRKAQKLSELMEKVGLTPAGDLQAPKIDEK